MKEPIGFGQSAILAAAKAQGRSANYIAALAFLLPEEGVYFEITLGDDGGPTCCGVTQECYNEYQASHGAVKASVQHITASEIAALYWEQNWHALGCDGWLPAVSIVMFDSGVNCGNREAVLFLQRAIGVNDDGSIGAATQAAEHAFVIAHGGLALGLAIINERRAYYDEIGAEHENDEQFEAGWHRRCDDLAAAILSIPGNKAIKA